MSVWPFLWGLTAVALVLTAGRGDWRGALALACVGVALMATRGLHDLPSGRYEMAAVLVWVVATTGVAIATLGRNVIVTMVLLIEIPCYLWAWVGEVPRTFGSPPWVLADLAVIVAVLSLSGAGHVLVGLRDLLRRRGDRSALGMDVLGGRPTGRHAPAVGCRGRVEGVEGET